MSAQLPIAIQTAKVPAAQANRGVVPKGKAPVAQPEVSRVVNEFQLDTVEIDTRPEPFAARATLLTIVAFFIFAVTWAALSPLDRIVVARGTVISTAPNVLVQPIESAIIRSIEVKVGDMVTAGTVLARLDPTFAEADMEQIEARIASLNAAIARLEAEQQGAPYEPALDSPDSRFDYARLQFAIWQERQTQLTAQMRLFDERIARVRASITAREREHEQLQQNLAIAREVEDMRTSLERAQTGSRLNSLVARSSRIEMERDLTRTANQITESRHELEAILAEQHVFLRGWHARIVEDLVAHQNDRDGLIEQRTKALRRKDMVQLETPVDAVVLEVAPRSVGSVIRDAEPLFRLVPLNAPLEVEARIDARQIGFVAVGDPVQIKLDAYNFQEHGMLEGVVRVISSDAFSTNDKNPTPGDEAFYRTRIEVTKMKLEKVPDDFRLIPGLPLSAEIKVGQRTVLAYLLRPILKGFREGLREP